MNPLISALMGQGWQTPPTAGPAPVEEEVVIENTPLPKSKYKDTGGILEALFPKTFAPGTTAGNILGRVKDGFLIQGGAKPMFSPRLQQLRAAEALEDFTTDPVRALQRYNEVDAPGALDAFNDYTTRSRQNKALDLQTEIFRDRRDQVTNDRVLAMLAGANEQTYPRVREQALRYVQSRKGSLPFELPETYDSATIEGLASMGIPVKDQARLESQREYREALMGQRDVQERGRNARAAQAEAGRAARTNLVQDRQDRRQERAIEARGKGGRAPRMRFDPKTRKFTQAQ